MIKRTIILALLVLLAACGSEAATVAPTTNTAAQATTVPAEATTAPPTEAAMQPVRVVTTMSILADVIRNVGGERVVVENIVPLGAGPEDYQATPGDSQKIANAQIVFFNGHELEEWIEPLFENAAAPNQPRIELSAGFAALEDDHAGESSAEPAGDEHEHAGGNPHFWLDPTNVMSYTMTIRDQLTVLDPAGAATYAANAEAYLAELAQLDADLQAQAATIPAANRKLVTNHDAFPYFAQRYGFEVVGVILENPEAELSAGDLAALINEVKAQKVKAIFGESQFNQKTAQLLADEAGVTTIGVLYTDTLGASGSGGATYIEMMRYNMQTIVAGLK